jgi:hypothetical protein
MKAAISKLNCVARMLVVVCLNAISDARAQSGGGMRVNENAVAFASQLLQEGHLIADRKGAWREHKPLPDKTSLSARTALQNTRSGISAWTNVTL